MKIFIVYSYVLLMAMAATVSANALASSTDEKVDREKIQTIDELASGPDEFYGGDKRGKRYANKFDGRLDFHCPSLDSISRITSHHDNHREDRRFTISCKRTFKYNPICRTSSWVNNFDAAFTYTCPNNGVIAGMISYHHNHYEDRRFAFKCCNSQFYQKHTYCYWTGYLNSFDQYLNWQAGSRYLAGVSSYHDNHREDRRFRFYVCDMTIHIT